MKTPAVKLVLVFVLTGLTAGLLNVLLGFLSKVFLFIAAGMMLGLGLGGAYALARWRNWLPAPASSVRYSLAGLLFGIGYPVAICFGAMVALVCEGLALAILPHAWYEVMRNREPLPMMGMMMFWGSLLGAFMVSAGLLVITDHWDKRIFYALSIAGVFSVAVTLFFFVPIYGSTVPLVREYREVIFFGVLIPVGDTLFSGLFAVGLLRAAHPQQMRNAAVAR